MRHYISTVIQQKRFQTSKKLPRPQLASRIETSLYVTAVALVEGKEGEMQGKGLREAVKVVPKL